MATDNYLKRSEMDAWLDMITDGDGDVLEWAFRQGSITMLVSRPLDKETPVEKIDREKQDPNWPPTGPWDDNPNAKHVTEEVKPGIVDPLM